MLLRCPGGSVNRHFCLDPADGGMPGKPAVYEAISTDDNVFTGNALMPPALSGNMNGLKNGTAEKAVLNHGRTAFQQNGACPMIFGCAVFENNGRRPGQVRQIISFWSVRRQGSVQRCCIMRLIFFNGKNSIIFQRQQRLFVNQLHFVSCIGVIRFQRMRFHRNTALNRTGSQKMKVVVERMNIGRVVSVPFK